MRSTPTRLLPTTIAETFPFSADLGIRALVMAISFGIVLGSLAALNRGKKLDFCLCYRRNTGYQYSRLHHGLCIAVFLRNQMGAVARCTMYKGFSYTILPATALAFYTLASVSKLMRSSMLEVVQQDYIKTAKAKGLSKFRITWKHQLRNAIMPVITMLGPTVASVLTGTFVIESIFAIPGMGKYYVESVSNNDYAMILGMTVFYGFFLVFCNLIVDVAYGFVDPRVRIGKK